MFCAIGLVTGTILFCTEYAYYSALANSGSLPGDGAATWAGFWLWVVQAGLFAYLGLLFPDGRLPSPRWRIIASFAAAPIVIGVAAQCLSPESLVGYGAIPNPLGIEGAPNSYGVVEAVTHSLTLMVASLLARLRYANSVERQQIKWFGYAAAVAALGAFFLYIVPDALGAPSFPRKIGLAATVVGLAGLPVALGVAVLRYRLHDIDLIINRTLVYGTLMATLAGFFEVTLVTLQHALLVLTRAEDSGLAYFGTAVVMAALFEPLKGRIDSFVEIRSFRPNGAGDELPEPVREELPIQAYAN
jgi:hypothetical protein